MEGYLLGLDNGGTVSKAALFDLNGREVAVASKKTEMIFPMPGFTERSAEALWQANVQAITEVIKKSGVDSSMIKAVAATGYGNGIIMIDKDGNPAYNAIVSTDTRAKDYIKKWTEDGTLEYAYKRTWSDIWAAQPVALLAWFKDHMPEVYKKTRWVLMCKDYVRYRLTGQVCAEITDYSGTSAMNLNTKEYDLDLFKRYGIEECFGCFPPVKMSSDICGYITKDAAEATGLREGTPVAGGLFDIHACCLSSGIIDSEKLCLIAGTWTINEYLSKEPKKSLFMNTLTCISGYYLITEASATSASNLEWFINQLMQSDKEMAEKEGRSIYDRFDEMVDKTSNEDSGIVFLPYLFGSNSNPNANACFLGMSSWHKKEHIIRAIYEGIVFSSKQHVDNLLKSREMPQVARISGGPSRSKVWVQMFADALQIPIEVVAGTELGALGAAMCAGVASGIFKSFSEAVDRMVKVSNIYFPDPEKRGFYEKKYEKYNKAVKITNEFWD